MILRISHIVILVLGFSLCIGVNSVFANQTEIIKSINMTEGIIFSENATNFSYTPTMNANKMIEMLEKQIQDLTIQNEELVAEKEDLKQLIETQSIPEIHKTIRSGMELVGKIIDTTKTSKEIGSKIIEALPKINANIDFVNNPENNNLEEKLERVKEIRKLVENIANESTEPVFSNVFTILDLQEIVLELTKTNDELKQKLDEPTDRICLPVCNQNTADNNDEEWYYEFFKDIVLVAIPVIVVGALAPKITQNWQTRSTKIKVKKEILETFAKSAILSKNLLHQFIGVYLRTYGNTTTDDYDEGVATYDLKVPNKGEESPKIKLEKEFGQLMYELDNAKRQDEPLLISMIRLYYRDEKMDEEYVEIQKQIGYLKTLVIELIDYKKMGILQKLEKSYAKKLEELNTNLKAFSTKLIETDIVI